MDPLTHCLAGITIANLGLKEVVPEAGWVVAGASVLPDIDYVTRFWGDRNFLRYHRVFTHSIVGAVLSSAIWAGGFYLIWPSSGYWPLFFLSLIGFGSHIFMDFLCPHGEKLLYPFSKRWYARERFVFFDPYFMALPAVGLILREVFTRFSLIVSWSAFSALIVYWAFREWSYRRCLGVLTRVRKKNRELVRADLSPIPGSLLFWRLVGEANNQYLIARINAFTLNVDEERSIPKPVRDNYISRAEQSEVVKHFLESAMYPMVESRLQGDRRIITWWDLAYIHREKKPQVRVILSEGNEILKENFIIWK
ncbi:MAG: metal-dependent hydrolase [Deltaproteobacteria bacterium]|nr:MAG: metal-dependent hydrolase [Deltaproteobacteria bacterium]